MCRTRCRLSSLVLGCVLVWAACVGGTESGEGGGAQDSPPAEPASAPAEDAAAGFYLGEPRQDLERFYGLYGEPPRQFFVTQAKRPKLAEHAPEIPPGYLAIGAMWGDVAPMQMKSLAENRFEQVDTSDFAPKPLHVVEFELGPDAKAVALTFTQGVMSEFGRRERVGDLPAGFE